MKRALLLSLLLSLPALATPAAPLLALLDEMPAFHIGPLAGKPWYQPRAGVTRAQLGTAGAGSCPIRTGILIALNPSGRIVTESQNGRLCGTADLLLCPAGWIGSGTSATCRPLPDGWLIVGARDGGAAASESDATAIAHECRCSSGSGCTAQKVNQDGTLAAASALPLWTIAGNNPPQSWRNPSAGCLEVACVEGAASREWPDTCPRP